MILTCCTPYFPSLNWALFYRNAVFFAFYWWTIKILNSEIWHRMKKNVYIKNFLLLGLQSIACSYWYLFILLKEKNLLEFKTFFSIFFVENSKGFLCLFILSFFALLSFDFKFFLRLNELICTPQTRHVDFFILFSFLFLLISSMFLYLCDTLKRVSVCFLFILSWSHFLLFCVPIVKSTKVLVIQTIGNLKTFHNFI